MQLCVHTARSPLTAGTRTHAGCALAEMGRGLRALACLVLSLCALPINAQIEVHGCQSFCTSSCFELNGNVDHECGNCPDVETIKCRPGQPGFDTSQARRDDYTSRTRGLPSGDGRGGTALPSKPAKAPKHTTTTNGAHWPKRRRPRDEL